MGEVSNVTVVLMGIGIVFVGLICIIVLCYISSWIIRLITKSDDNSKAPVKQNNPSTISESKPFDIANKGEFVAAVSAAIAEDLGKDVSAIRITKIKRV